MVQMGTHNNLRLTNSMASQLIGLSGRLCKDETEIELKFLIIRSLSSSV